MDRQRIQGGVMEPRSNRIISFAAVVCASAAFACTAATGDSAKETGKTAKNPTGATPASLAPTSPVAVIGDKTITLVDLDAQAAGALVRVRQEEYDARKQALDNMINDEVTAKESAAKGKTKEELLKAEVADKVADPAQPEIDAFYDQNKARFGAQTKEQLAPQIAAMLKNQKMMDAQ